ncbi:hypothetical protein HDU76_012788 [Blyttiomyces sp. JEL0837]|nr:hypothetical protein HDU76_012788 [Blyttiomyces sp. JEL0837]
MDSFSFDEGTTLFLTEDSAVFGAIRGDAEKVLVFDFNDGSFHVERRYDEFTPTASQVLEEHLTFGVVGLLDLGFGKYILSVDSKELAATMRAHSVWRLKGIKIIPIKRRAYLSLDEEEHEKVSLERVTTLLTSGHFYFSINVDLTNGCQRAYDKGVRDTAQSASITSQMEFAHLESRYIFNIVSRDRAGAQFHRGLNADGQCAIEVETEIIHGATSMLSSFRMIRGSLPLIWRYNTDMSQRKRLDLADAAGVESKQALVKHLENLLQRYGANITIIDLLSAESVDLEALGKIFETTIMDLDRSDIDYLHFNGSKLSGDEKTLDIAMKDVRKYLDKQGFFCAHSNGRSLQHIFSAQKGIFRINGLNCVDTTNSLEYRIGLEVLSRIIHLHSGGYSHIFTSREKREISKLWDENGDAIAFLYMGTSSIYRCNPNSSWIPLGLGNIVRYHTVRISRSYMTTFQEDVRQEGFDLVLGRNLTSTDPIENLRHAIETRRRILFFEVCQRPSVAFILVLRRLYAPHTIRGITSFTAASGWLMLYILLRKLGVAPLEGLKLKRHGSRTDLSNLPHIQSPRVIRGLAANKAQESDRDIRVLLNSPSGKRELLRKAMSRKLSHG